MKWQENAKKMKNKFIIIVQNVFIFSYLKFMNSTETKVYLRKFKKSFCHIQIRKFGNVLIRYKKGKGDSTRTERSYYIRDQLRDWVEQKKDKQKKNWSSLIGEPR